MKTLHLLRHAKSSWKDPGLEDIDRPLNKRGKKACQLMAPIVEAQLDHNTVIACSNAARAQETRHRLMSSFTSPFHYDIDDELYTFSSASLIRYICQLDTSLDSIMLIGHNPAFTDLANILCGEIIDNIPTCGYVKIRLPIENWAALSNCQGELVVFIRPRDIDC